MAEQWSSQRFSLSNPRSDSGDDLPRLLRRLAQEIEDRGISGADVDDLTVSQEATVDGSRFSATLYWTPGDVTTGSAAHEAETASGADATADAASEVATRVGVAEALPGVQIYPLPPHERVVALFALVKTRDADGVPGWWSRTTHDYNRHEFLGALTAYVDHLRAEEASSWSDDEDAPHSHPDTDT